MASSKATAAIGTAAPARNFTITSEDRARAAIAGPPAYALRRRRIEDMEDALVARLAEIEVEARAAHPGDEVAAREALARAARGLDLSRINALVEKHNRYYPCEANLPMDTFTGALLERGRPWRPMPLYTWEALIALMAAPQE
jgi:hypothetical protein